MTWFKTGDPRDIKNIIGSLAFCHRSTKYVQDLQTTTEKPLYENQPREQAGLQREHSTGNQRALKQSLKKIKRIQPTTLHNFNWWWKSLWQSRAVFHLWIFEKSWHKRKYVKILQHIYDQVTARIYLDDLVFGKFSINKGVIQGDLTSLTLFTTGMEEIFTTADISEGINVKTKNTSQTQGLPVMLTSSTKKKTPNKWKDA